TARNGDADAAAVPRDRRRDLAPVAPARRSGPGGARSHPLRPHSGHENFHAGGNAMKRRSLLLRSATLLVASSSAFAVGEAIAQQKQVTVRIGYNPLAGSLPILGTMMSEKLFEKEASKFGYQVTPEWIQFLAGAPPANAAMLAGRLDMDVDFGTAAIVPRIKNKIPIAVFGIHASHLSNAVVVRAGSDIDDVSKLAGKTIGVPLATSAHYTLAPVVLEGTGKSLQELGVKLVNMTPAESIKMPAGL